MSSLQSYTALLAALNDLRRVWRWQRTWEGLLLTLTATLLMFFAVVLADNLLQGSPWSRLLLAFVLWGVALAALGRWVIVRRLEDRRDDFFAALVEQHNPTLRNRLINALQLGRGDQRGHSADLIDAIIEDASRATADLEMERSLDPRPLRRAGLYLGAAVLLLLGYAMVSPAKFSNGAQRVLLPLAAIPPYTHTRIPDANVLPGDTSVAENDALRIEATVEGVVPSSANLVLDFGTRRESRSMQPDPNAPERFRAEISALTESFRYQIEAGDGRSRSFAVEVVARPRIESLTLTVQPPSYTQRSAQTKQASGEIDIFALPGSKISLEITTNRPLDQAQLRGREDRSFGELGREPTEAAVTFQRLSDKTYRTAFMLSTPNLKATEASALRALLVAGVATQYQIRLTADDKRKTRNFTEANENRLGGPLDPLWRTIGVVPDLPPTGDVSVVREPTWAKRFRDARLVPANATLPTEIVAKDDFGVGSVKLWAAISDGVRVEEKLVHQWTYPHEVKRDIHERFAWNLAELGVRGGEALLYWLEIADKNDVTGPGISKTTRRTLLVVAPDSGRRDMDVLLSDYIEALEFLLKRQTDTLVRTKAQEPFPMLLRSQEDIRTRLQLLARRMEKDNAPVGTIIAELDRLRVEPVAKLIQLFEEGSTSNDPSQGGALRERSLPLQQEIIESLKALIARLQKNERAREALRRLEKTDKLGHKETLAQIDKLGDNLARHLQDATKVVEGFERLKKKPVEELKAEEIKEAKDKLEEFAKRTEKWTKESVNEMTKLPEGFVKDFDLRPDANRIFEEIEAKARAKAEKLEISLEDLGAGLGTKMKEDLEMWLPDAADSVKWVQEEPLNQKPFNVPEMPLPKELEDLIGELLQKADEFDEEADDVTSAWGDNLDQAGWGVSDGPISMFSAKGKTGNDQPNSQEVTGRSGDGRRGKSAGQMVGDTARGLPGRKTPARVGNERYEPGQLKQEGVSDPSGATGGGKKAGAGRIGLQGGSMPELLKQDLGRLNEKQTGLREDMKQIAKKLEDRGYNTSRLNEAIRLLEKPLLNADDFRSDDPAKKLKTTLQKIRTDLRSLDPTAAESYQPRGLPRRPGDEAFFGSDESAPAGYEKLADLYLKKLSEKQRK